MEHDAFEHDPSAEGGSNRPRIKLVLLLVVVIATAIFFFQNGQDAAVDFLWMNGTWPMWMVIGISVAAGIVIAYLVVLVGMYVWRRARRRKNAAQE